MKSIGQFIRGFVVVAVSTFVVSAGVTYVYSLVAHDAPAVDWGSAVRLAVILGIVIALVDETRQ